MRTIKRLSIAVAALALVAVLIGCGSEQSQTEMTTHDQAQPAAEAAATVTPYPLDYCIVSGEKLGEMGDPIVKTYKGHEVKFCCNMCVSDFEANVDMYLAKIDSAAVGTMKMDGHEGHDHGDAGHDG